MLRTFLLTAVTLVSTFLKLCAPAAAVGRFPLFQSLGSDTAPRICSRKEEEGMAIPGPV